MTLGDAGFGRSPRYGVVVDLPGFRADWNKDVQRAEGDGSGSPVAGTEEIIATVPGSQTRIVDSPPDTSKTWVYRWRYNRHKATEGQFTDWTADLTAQLLGDQQDPPRDARSILRGTSEALLTEVLQRLRDDGHLGSGARINVGGTLWNLTRARQDGSNPDGDTVTFPTAYPTAPKVNVRGGQGISSHTDFEANTQFPVMRPDTLDNQGFNMVGILQDRSAQSLQTDTFPAGTLTAQGDALSLAGQTEGENGGSGLTDDAVDDSYTTEFNVDLQVTDGGEPPAPTTSSLKVVVAVDKWDSDDAVWQEAGIIEYNLSASSGGTDSIDRNDTIEFTDSGVEGGDDVRVRIKEVTVTCGSEGCSSSVTVDPVETTYNVATTNERSMSPNNEKLEWVARQEVN